MIILKIVDICLIIALLIVTIETMIKLKKIEGKLINDVRKKIILRLNIMTILIIAISIISTIMAILNNIYQ